MRYLTQISSIIVAFIFVYAVNFKSFVTIDYFINQAEITELFCINKEKPQLQCNGKCHLAKQLVKVDTEKEELPFSQNTNEYSLELIFDLGNKTALSSCGLSKKENKWFSFTEAISSRTMHVLTPPPEA
ncbi:MAG: hypothetical protein J5I47_12680 [Vicingus serpentipes]|nr:hypothetical protein [Vicingus serpentipes]